MSKLIHGDALEELRTLADESVDLVVTDPPYNVNYGYNSYKDNLAAQEYLDWQLEILRECERVLRPDGNLFYLNYPEFNSSVWVALQNGFTLKPVELIAWVYNTHTSGSPLRKAFRTWIWASKGDIVHGFEGEYKNQTDKRVMELIAKGKKPLDYDWWHYEQVKNVSTEKLDHPCQVPLKMVKKIIAATTKPGDVVLDMFAGSGTTLKAAAELEREYIGIEVDEKYIGLIEQRLKHVQVSML